MKVNRCGLTLGQGKGNGFCRLFGPFHVHPSGPQVNAAYDPATLLDSAPVGPLPPRIYYRIKAHTGKGNEKVR
jgi:hypothetical protein